MSKRKPPYVLYETKTNRSVILMSENEADQPQQQVIHDRVGEEGSARMGIYIYVQICMYAVIPISAQAAAMPSASVPPPQPQQQPQPQPQVCNII